MKSINNYISEKLIINKNTGKKYYKYFPETIDELQDIIEQRILKEGYECNLNDIDVSKITDMYRLFIYSDFNGDISKWDVSNVENMNQMFYKSKFNKDISEWNVSNVEDMSNMFAGSNFNQDISNWNVNNVKDMEYIFKNSPLQGKEKEWWNK